MRRRPTSALVPLRPSASALLFAAGLAACGGEKPPKATSNAAPPAAAPRADSTPAVAAATPGTARGDTTRPATGAPGDTGRAGDVRVALRPGRTTHDSLSLLSAVRAGKRDTRWPVKGPTTNAGAVLPAQRIVAFYGNPLSTRMGILGELPPDQMLARLDQAVAEWRAADPSTPVKPALHLIAVVAQGSAGRDGMWRARMDSALIEKVYGWARQRDALLFLDIQVAKSTLRAELPRLLPFLARPDVHLGVDPEFSMHYEREGLAPGKKIGMLDARDVNYAVETLAKLVAEHHLPPKVLVVHRFTRKMVTNAAQIRPDPAVQVVMHMDGWGPPWLKFDSYRDYVVAEPVQYTGFKLFFKNDVKKGDALLTAAEVLQLRPAPLYVQYQ